MLDILQEIQIFMPDTKIHSKKIIKNSKKQLYLAPVPIEYATRKQSLLPSSTPSMAFLSSCSSISPSSSAPSELCSLYFPLSTLSSVSVFSPLDSGQEIRSSSRVFDLIPAIFSSASATLWTWTTNSSTFSNFFNTCSFHFVSICCFVFLAHTLLAVSSIAFLHAPSASKGLQAAFALAQGEHDVAFLKKTELTNNPTPERYNTYGRSCGKHKMPKLAHLSQGLPAPIGSIPSSFAISSLSRRCSRVSLGR